MAGDLSEGRLGRVLRRAGFRFYVLIPLKSRERTLGFLLMVHRYGRTLDPESLQFLDSLGNIIGVALENALLYQEIAHLLEATRYSEQQLRTVLESAADAVAILQDGRFRHCNAYGLHMLGYSLEEIRARHFLDVVREDFRDLVSRCYLTHEKRESSAPQDIVLVGRDGRQVLVNINACAIEYEGRPSVLIIARDITETKRLREQILQLEKMAALGQLVSGVAHELNNPLAVIIGYSELLRVDSAISPAVLSGLNAIYEAALRARRIVQNLLTFARPHQSTRSRVKINELIESTLALRAYHLRVNHIEVIKDLDPNLPPVRADGYQLQQVFLNLIVNAEQAMLEAHGRGELLLRTEYVPPSDAAAIFPSGSRAGVRITISDDGPGIPEPLLHRIFEPFFTTKPVGQGTGLGLSISHSIIQEHGGQIYARSQPGQGATFIIELPIAGEEDDPVGPARVLPPPSARAKSLLIVDDEVSLLDLIKRLVEAEGHRADTASDGLQALEKLRRQPYDLIPCDVKMPGLDGRQLYDEITERWPEMVTRIIFLTGDLVDPQTQTFLSRVQRPVLEKPFPIEELLRVLREQLR